MDNEQLFWGMVALGAGASVVIAMVTVVITCVVAPLIQWADDRRYRPSRKNPKWQKRPAEDRDDDPDAC